MYHSPNTCIWVLRIYCLVSKTEWNFEILNLPKLFQYKLFKIELFYNIMLWLFDIHNLYFIYNSVPLFCGQECFNLFMNSSSTVSCSKYLNCNPDSPTGLLSEFVCFYFPFLRFFVVVHKILKLCFFLSIYFCSFIIFLQFLEVVWKKWEASSVDLLFGVQKSEIKFLRFRHFLNDLLLLLIHY